MFYGILYIMTNMKGINMLIKLNRFLRKIVLVLGALCMIFKLLDRDTDKPKSKHKVKTEGFQTHEFDDIW